MAIGEGVAEVPDSEEEPLTSSPDMFPDSTVKDPITTSTEEPLQKASPEANWPRQGSENTDSNGFAKHYEKSRGNEQHILLRHVASPEIISQTNAQLEPLPQTTDELETTHEHASDLGNMGDSFNQQSSLLTKHSSVQHSDNEQKLQAYSITGHDENSLVTPIVYSVSSTLHNENNPDGRTASATACNSPTIESESEFTGGTQAKLSFVEVATRLQQGNDLPTANVVEAGELHETDAHVLNAQEDTRACSRSISECPQPHEDASGSEASRDPPPDMPISFPSMISPETNVPHGIVDLSGASKQHPPGDPRVSLVDHCGPRGNNFATKDIGSATCSILHDHSPTLVVEGMELSLPILTSDAQLTMSEKFAPCREIQSQDTAKVPSRDQGEEESMEVEGQAQPPTATLTKMDVSSKFQYDVGATPETAAYQPLADAPSSASPPTKEKPPTLAKRAQEVTLSELKAQRAALIASLAILPGIQELIAGAESLDSASHTCDTEPTEIEIINAAQQLNKRHIKLLHEYNEIKDVGQGLMGLIADQRGIRIVEVQEEFGIESRD
ncbi:hypothetical protein N0V90_001575 [Kalmusia sp. IMI 367209]|nr:hypothetical protein N0V90_001575 [Kalmusia sp. IMI 367209]